MFFMVVGDVWVFFDFYDVNVIGYDFYIYVYDGIILVGFKIFIVLFLC